MVYDGVLEGRYVDLKSCSEDDAEFTHALRHDPQFKDFFPPLNNTLAQQKEWIRGQREKPDDYFFVVWDKEGKRIGTISLYSTMKGMESGRLIVMGNSLQAIESQILLFDFSFFTLGTKEVYSTILSDNSRAIRFCKQFGGVQIGVIKDTSMIEFVVKANAYEDSKKGIIRLIYR